jgi:hypothetical protein
MKTTFEKAPVTSEWKVLHQRANIISPEQAKKNSVKTSTRQRSFLMKIMMAIYRLR